MKITLINPSMNLKKLGRFAWLLEPMPCIGLAYIAGALEHHGVDVSVIDMFAEGFSADDVLTRVKELEPDVVGMTVLTPSEPVCTILSDMIRGVLPKVKIVWGAVWQRYLRKILYWREKADFVVHHDGEQTICELIGCFNIERRIFSK